MKIVSIENGWIFAKYKLDNTEHGLQGSNLFGYNILKEILSMMYSFLRDEEQQKFIIWNQESDYYICEYLNDSGNIKKKLLYSNEVCDESVIRQEKFKLEQMDVIFTETRDLWSWSKEMYVDIGNLYNEKINDKVNSDSTKELIDKLGYYLQNIGYNY